MDPWMKWGALCLLHNPMARSQDRSLSLTRPLVFSGRVNRVFGKYAEMDTCQPSKFIVYILYIYTHTCRQTIHLYCLFTHLLQFLCLPKRSSQRNVPRQNLRPATRARGCLPRSDSSPPRPSGCHRASEITGDWISPWNMGNSVNKKNRTFDPPSHNWRSLGILLLPFFPGPSLHITPSLRPIHWSRQTDGPQLGVAQKIIQEEMPLPGNIL